MTSKVFLSHGRADSALAVQLAAQMRTLGVEVFDDVAIGPDANGSDSLRDALEAADAVVFLAPEPGKERSNLSFFEIGAASAIGKRIIPVLPTLDPRRIAELPAGVRSLRLLDGSRLAPEALARTIVESLQAA